MFDVPVKYICSNNYSIVKPDDTLKSAYDSIGDRKEKILIVMDEEKIVGVLKNTDFIDYFGDLFSDTKVETAMTKNVIIVEPETPVRQVKKIMFKNKIPCVLVGDFNNLFGTVGVLDINIFFKISNSKGLLNTFDFYKLADLGKEYYDTYRSILSDLNHVFNAYRLASQTHLNNKEHKVLKYSYKALIEMSSIFKKKLMNQENSIFMISKKIQQYMNIRVNNSCDYLDSRRNYLNNIMWVFNRNLYGGINYLDYYVFKMVHALEDIIKDIGKKLKNKKNHPYVIEYELLLKYKQAYYDCLFIQDEMKACLDEFPVICKAKDDLDSALELMTN